MMPIAKKISATCLFFIVLASQYAHSSALDQDNNFEKKKCCFKVTEAIAVGHVLLDGVVATVHKTTEDFYRSLGTGKLPVPWYVYQVAKNNRVFSDKYRNYLYDACRS